MYKILVVDDEKKEREGIALLIRRYGFKLDVTLAGNGEEALEEMEKEEFDILLTDIKMPFMTGIELIEQVHKRGYSPICIIFSAYGEFEYAQNAISLGVIQYLLKPILLDDFEKLFIKVCQLCEEKEKRRKEAEAMIEGKRNQEKQAVFRNFLFYLEEGYLEDNDKAVLQKFLAGNKYRMVMLLGYSFLFSIHWKDYSEDIKRITGEETWIMNADDAQLLLLVPVQQDESDKFIRSCCEKLIKVSKENHQFDVFIAASPVCTDIIMMKNEFEKLHETMDYQFFMTESSYILCDKDYLGKKQSDMLPVYFSKILTSAKLQNFKSVIDDFKNVFRYIDDHVGFSSLYIKYSFTDIMKRLCEIMNTEHQLVDMIEKIYEAKSLEMMKQIIIQYLQGLEVTEEEDESDNRLVYLAKKMVGERYQDVSLGVSMIADELHVSLAYLSTLFKLETGQTLVKYITNYRMEQAKCLLETSNMKVADVANRVGYLNTSYFISLFRNREGCSPQVYREKQYHDEKA